MSKQQRVFVDTNALIRLHIETTDEHPIAKLMLTPRRGGMARIIAGNRALATTRLKHSFGIGAIKRIDFSGIFVQYTC